MEKSTNYVGISFHWCVDGLIDWLINWLISACQTQAIGVANRLSNTSFSASSWRLGDEPHKGRLNGDGAWSPGKFNDPDDYLQIDLGDVFFICAVATQGHGSRRNEWTTSYKLQLLRTEWTIYKENSTEKVWEAYMWTSFKSSLCVAEMICFHFLC